MKLVGNILHMTNDDMYWLYMLVAHCGVPHTISDEAYARMVNVKDDLTRSLSRCSAVTAKRSDG